MIVQQDKIEPAARAGQIPDTLDSFLAARRQHRIHFPADQGSLQETPVGRIVIDDHHLQAGKLHRGLNISAAAASISCREGTGEMEGAADS